MTHSPGEELLAVELAMAGIPFVREYRFAPPRRWRLDFVLGTVDDHHSRLAIEVDGGSWTGGHRRGKAAEGEAEKLNQLALDGWKVLHFTPAMVESGEAIRVVKRAWTWPLNTAMPDPQNPPRKETR